MRHVYLPFEDDVFRIFGLALVCEPELELTLGLLTADLDVLCFLVRLELDLVVLCGVLRGNLCDSIDLLDKPLFKVRQRSVGLGQLELLL